MWPIDHQWCFERAQIKNDNRDRINLVDQFATEINRGLEEADTGLGGIQTPYGNIPIAPVMHYLDPHTNNGIGGWIGIGVGYVTNAALFCESCFTIARELWQKPDNALSMVTTHPLRIYCG